MSAWLAARGNKKDAAWLADTGCIPNLLSAGYTLCTREPMQHLCLLIILFLTAPYEPFFFPG